MQGRPIVLYGPAWWNRPTLVPLLEATLSGAVVHHARAFEEGLAQSRRLGARLVVWASKLSEAQERAAADAGVPLTRIEDGFIRSVGLGAGLAAGASNVIDETGIYSDATRPSDIETLLETTDVSAAERQRAADLRRAIIDRRISKYNVGRSGPPPVAPAGLERILVVGQVASDAGVRRTLSATIDCAGSHNVNLDLLAAARARFPRAHISYKPHPDVASGLRPGQVPAADLTRLADRVVADADIVSLIEACDRLVTLSSLAGFEALLRGKPVTVFGVPFYAGWGLTDDVTPAPRRSRRLDVEALTAIALLRYCRYVDPVTRTPCTPEALIARLSAQRASRLHRIGARLKQQASWAGRRLGL